ncbi:hypothetical protein GCK72_001552 [Caenorhabditis remanei]|uniref:F-box domain-containing protein n=1 Tax=Caenorhabditis remanei TaxID=31234 RepID=A0A6A5HQ11_CAERE|nr:hypothetical protein GCK72_001552 [Caenorhabditis remanei]KAF1769735.1 hypothetical protein GCK72_001552 [Caenorhabditis remanei]
MSDPFPFLELPVVNVRGVLEFLDVSDLLKLSSCDKLIQNEAKSMNQIKSFSSLKISQKEQMSADEVFELLQLQLLNEFNKFHRMNIISFGLKFSTDIGIEIVLKDENTLKWNIYVEFIGEMDNYNGVRTTVEVEDRRVPGILISKKNLYTFWNDRISGLKTLVAWMIRTYHIRFDTFHLIFGTQSEYSEELKSIVNFVNYRQNSYNNLIIDEKEGLIDDKDIKFVMYNVNAFRKYTHLGPRSDRRLYYFPFRTESILISHAHWFTWEQLFFSHCATINIVDSPIRNEELKGFVSLWLDGYFPRLKHLTVKTKNIMVLIILFGNGIRRGYIRNGVYMSSNNKLIPIPVGVIIENQTATRAATIIFPPQNPPGSRKLMAFEMVVWPDYDGFSYDRNEVIPPGM